MTSDGLLGAIGRKIGRDGDGRIHQAPVLPNLPEETFHVVYDVDLDQARFAKLSHVSDTSYREEWSVAVPRFIAKYLMFDAKVVR